MRNYLSIFSVIAALTSGCVAGRCETTNAPLTFHIVSEQKMEGGRFIDTADLPKVGYISASPDLAVTNLLDVYRVENGAFDIVNGKAVPSQPTTQLAVALRPADAKRFTALTRKAQGKRLLVTLGGRPLTAPKVVAPIEADRFSIGCANESELKQTQDELKKLVPR